MFFSPRSILVLLLALTLSSCHPEPDPKPLSDVARASIQIKSDVLNLRTSLRLKRNASAEAAVKFGYEVIMSVLSSGVRVTLDDLVSDQGPNIAKAGLAKALEAELLVAQDDSVLALIGSDAAKPTKAQFATLLDSVAKIRKMIPVTSPDITGGQISQQWIDVVQLNLDYAQKMKTVITQLNDAIQVCAASGAAGVGELVPAFLKSGELEEGFGHDLEKIAISKKEPLDDWATLKARALRTDAFNQLFAQWFTTATVTPCNLPTDATSEFFSSQKETPEIKSCSKMSNGDSAGTSGGSSQGSTISPCLIAGGDVKVSPPKPQ